MSRLLHIGLTGAVVQGVFLTAFIFVSQTRIAAIGKPFILVCALVVMTLLLWQGVRRAKDWRTLCLLPLALALGYIVSFHLVGLLGFPGLLREFDLSTEYLTSILSVTGAVLLLYAAGTVVIYFFTKTVRTHGD